MTSLELWGGHECTLNRVRNTYIDQTVRSGHETRVSDLDAFAALGLKRIRYPMLWERVAPRDIDAPDWTWTDKRFNRLKSLNMEPIAGLVHHGAGPRYATLDTDDFAPGLARFARMAAERYPWISAWTPVNEPLTTARFSALYGHWYPHGRDEAMFWRVLLNEIDAIRLAMAEIRKVNPDAALVQTEDIGRTYGTAETADQVAFDNARRWMTWDLLAGRVDAQHPLWLRLARLGFGDRLRRILDQPCPADIIGINHYLTSDRFLDHRVTRYPRQTRGGNRFIRFADVEAVRVLHPAPCSLRTAMEETWSRYRTPIAVTEVHNGCTRDEQMRWIAEAWANAEDMRACGADIRAVTVWSLLGAYDWNSLLKRRDGWYEPGAFDVRSGKLRPTAVARYVAELAKGDDTPPCEGQGWWRRDVRLQYQPVQLSHDAEPAPAWRGRHATPRGPVLIIGSTGTLGAMLARCARWRDLDYFLASRELMPLSSRDACAQTVDRVRPSAIINAAGWVRVDDAEHDPQGCRAANTDGALMLADICASRGIPFITYSSDLVFDGLKGAAYVESDPTRALGVYGDSKARADEALLRHGGKNLILRTAAFFSPYDGYNFAAHVIRQLSAGEPFEAASDLVVSPTYVPDLADATFDLMLDAEQGVWHLANRSAVSWADFARLIARYMKLDAGLVVDRPAAHFRWPAARPTNVALASERGELLPPLEHALQRYAAATPRMAQQHLASMPEEHQAIARIAP